MIDKISNALTYIGKASCLILVFSCLIFMSLSIISLTNYYHERYKLTLLNDNEKYLVDFSAILDTDWEGSSIKKSFEDMRGWHHTIAGTSSRFYNNGLAYVWQYVMTYSNSEQSYKRYWVQRDWLIVNYGLSMSSFSIPLDTNPNANVYEMACDNRYSDFVLKDIRCGGLFLYGKHIVFLDIFPMRDYISFLTEDDLIKIFVSIDKKMQQE